MVCGGCSRSKRATLTADRALPLAQDHSDAGWLGVLQRSAGEVRLVRCAERTSCGGSWLAGLRSIRRSQLEPATSHNYAALGPSMAEDRRAPLSALANRWLIFRLTPGEGCVTTTACLALQMLLGFGSARVSASVSSSGA